MKPDSIKIATNTIATKAAQRAPERDFACVTSANLRLSVCLMSLPSFILSWQCQSAILSQTEIYLHLGLAS